MLLVKLSFHHSKKQFQSWLNLLPPVNFSWSFLVYLEIYNSDQGWIRPLSMPKNSISSFFQVPWLIPETSNLFQESSLLDQSPQFLPSKSEMRYEADLIFYLNLLQPSPSLSSNLLWETFQPRSDELDHENFLTFWQ